MNTRQSDPLPRRGDHAFELVTLPQARLHVDGENVFVGGPDEIAIVDVAELNSIPALPQRTGFIEGKTKHAQIRGDLRIGGNKPHRMRLDVGLRSDDGQPLRTPPDAFELNVIAKDSIAQAQAPQIACGRVETERTEPRLAREGGFPNSRTKRMEVRCDFPPWSRSTEQRRHIGRPQRAASAFREVFERLELCGDPLFPLGNRIPWLTHICQSHACSRSFWSAVESGLFCFCKVHIRWASSSGIGWGSSGFMR